MCGILGVYDNSNLNTNRFNESLNLLSRRGPDNKSAKALRNQLIFGHTRLSIIDLDSQSNQPFSLQDRYHVTFNGEIFNYIELKEELLLLGHNFKTNSDTEVLLCSYIEWGEKCIERFNGMWAFAIFDSVKNIIFCSRDRFGIKPFYFYNDNNKFIFSSLIAPILNYNQINYPNSKSISDFLYKGNIGSLRFTWFKGINRLLPGENLIYDFKNLTINRYYDLKFGLNKNSLEKNKIILKKIFDSSLQLRLRSDVEVCSTLTSGLDSSIIVSSIKNKKIKINTYTVFSPDNIFSNYDKKYFVQNINMNETKFLDKFENNYVNTNQIELQTDIFFKDLKFCIKEIESGHASPAIVGINQLYKDLNFNNKKVLLEGQGADETFSGYITDMFFEGIKYYLINADFKKCFRYIIETLQVYRPKDILQRFYSNYFSNSFYVKLKILILRTNVSKVEFFNFSYPFKNIFERHQKVILGNLLLYGDKLSMANSIETRFPFLDYRLVDFANSLPFNHKISNGKGKFILREAFKDILPSEIYDSKIKIGFAIPIDKILKENIDIKKLLYRDIDFYFNQKKLNNLLDRYYNGNFQNYNFIFKILTIKIWYIQFKESF